MRVLLVTGMSGSGKSIALNVLEDAGYAVVDNLPARFLIEVVSELKKNGHTRVATSIDVRAGVASVTELPGLIPQLRRLNNEVQVLYLTADTPTLVQRFSETRRRHPLSTTGSERTLEECIDEERQLLEPLDGIGHVIDTSGLAAQTLRAWVTDFIGSDRAELTLMFESFAYKNGVPMDADLVFDARCLPNPFYDTALRPLSGKDAPVVAFLRTIPDVTRFIDDIRKFLVHWLPIYAQDNRAYLTVAIGCTGGQHRSVYCAEELAQNFREHGPVLLRHRALETRAANHFS